MKKKIIIGLSIFALFFFAGSIYIIISVELTTSRLDNIIMLHQIRVLRERFLVPIEKIQLDLDLKNTRYAENMNRIITRISDMEGSLHECFNCHHSRHVVGKLNDLRNQTHEYQDLLSRTLTIRADHSRLEAEEKNAFKIGETLATNINDIITMADLKSEKTVESAFKEVADAKIILYILTVLGPLSIAVLAFIFIRGISKPIDTLLHATRRLKEGDLDYKIEGLKDEFGEVAISFNEMTVLLNEHMRKIEESEKRYRMLFEGAGDAIFILEAEGENAGRIVAANQAAAKMHGYTVDELLKLNIIKDLDTPDAAKDAPERIRRILNGEWVKAEIAHYKKDGTVFPVEISAGVLEVGKHKYILAFDSDITERKKMERLILQSKIDWEDTFDTIPDMITIHDRDFNIVRANKAAKKILGLPDLELTKAKCYEYLHGKDRPPGGCPGYECFKTGKSATLEMFEPRLNRFLEIMTLPRFDENNQLIGLIHFMRDITERKQIEEALQRTEQMKIVGELAVGLAHEIRDPLAAINVSMEVLSEESTIQEENKAIMLKVIDEIRRIDLLVKNLLNFAKPPQPQLSAVDMNDILDKTISFSLKHPLLSSNIATGINVLKYFDSSVPEVMADPMQLQQIFLNLLFNAIEAMPYGGTLTVKTFYDSAVNSIRIEISDTGKGIDEKMIDKVFQPFFTTKSKGTGLGLAITKGLIEQHGGTIIAENNPDGGTIFRINIPVNI